MFLRRKAASLLMERHGYPLSATSPNLLRLVWSAFSLPTKLLPALLFNLTRMRNIRETVKRRLA